MASSSAGQRMAEAQTGPISGQNMGTRRLLSLRRGSSAMMSSLGASTASVTGKVANAASPATTGACGAGQQTTPRDGHPRTPPADATRMLSLTVRGQRKAIGNAVAATTREPRPAIRAGRGMTPEEGDQRPQLSGANLQKSDQTEARNLSRSIRKGA